MRYEVREMAFAEILDTGFRLLRDHFVLLVGIAATLHIPLALIQEVLASAAENNATLAVVVSLVMTLLLLAISPIIGAASTYAIGEVYLGRETTIGDSMRKGLSIFVPLLGTSILAALATMGGMLLLILPGIWVALGLIVLSQVMVLEGRFGTSGLSRSFERQRGRAFGILFVVLLVQGVIGFGVGLALGAIPVLGGIAAGVVAAVSGAYTAAVSVVLYFDIRCRKDAFEIEQLARIVESGAAGAAV
jgi:hypothetical protein